MVEKEKTFVDLLGDAGFKAVYADQQNKPHLIRLLNHVLPEGVVISDITKYRDREQERDTVYSKKTILDLVCEDDKGNIFSVEVQKSTRWVMFNRCVYYASKHYHGHLLEGGNFETLHPVYEVAFLEGRLGHEDESLWNTDNLISQFRFMENRTGECAPSTIFITFVELGRFTKTDAECDTERDRLFYWMKHSGERNDKPGYASTDTEMEGLVEATRIAAFSPEKKAIYDKDMMTEQDILHFGNERYDEGVEEGIVKGKEEGAREKALKMAKNMLGNGIDAALVAKCAELPLEEILALQ